MTAPQPGLDPEPQPPRRSRNSRDPFERNSSASELSWGPGLVPRHLNGRPPSEGGIYMGFSPRVELGGKSPDLSVIPRQVRRPKGEARGYPGERIG